MRIPEGVTNILSRSIVIYAVAAVILFGIVDHKKVTMDRLNAVLVWGDYPAQLESGQAPYDERSLRFAVRYYKLVADILPQSDQPYATIGYCYARLGEYARAVKYYKQALSKNKDHFWLEYDLGMLYDQTKNLSRAYDTFQNITGRDIQSLVKSSALSGLSRMPIENRRLLLAKAGDFSVDLREKSFQMMVKVDLEGKNYSRALSTALSAARDPAVRDKGLFLLYAGAAAYGAGQAQESVGFCRIMASPEGGRRQWSERILARTMERLKGQSPDDGDLWQQFLSDPKVFPQAGAGVVMHPWAFYIQPGKEAYL